jgi:hypothetical protein
MGTLHQGPLASLAGDLAAKYRIGEFVETGTFEGDCCSWAVRLFPSVTTIEINEGYFLAARAKFGSLPIRFLLGDSATLLPQVVADLAGPALFWLDGHSGGGHFGPDDNCPLLAELGAIARSPFEHFIIVDDARAFLAPPPPPFIPERWPTILEVLQAARRSVPYYCVVIEDAVICVPPRATEDLIRFCDTIRPTI